ncbi:MAG: hydrogenase expression/formation protein HypE [Anaerolineae bacterium]|nr:hydrogenase expression/formation protein HypE [Anaerolineae bacterium]
MNTPPSTITMAHGSGGELGHELVEQIFVKHFNNAVLAELNDAAILRITGNKPRDIAFTTDSYVISPLFFPGGDIGKLSVCGTVNDLAVTGARPLYLSAGFIIEEGLQLDTLEHIVASMAETARAAGVQIVTGDTKVVDRGAADELFINTAGVGVFEGNKPLSPRHLQPGDAILVSGTMGDHGMAIMIQREGLAFNSLLTSDCAPLNGLIADLLAACPATVRCMRDPTRGGLTATLNEWAAAANVGIEIKEGSIPLREQVRGACEFLGLDPLYVANEGKVVIAVTPNAAQDALTALQDHQLGRDAAIIGRVTDEHPGRVALRTVLGARRILRMLVGEQLPRIC